MATTGRGRDPLNSVWSRQTPLRKPIAEGTDGVAAKAIWTDWFIAAAGGAANTTGTIAATQAVQSSAGAALERFLVTAGSTQASQSSAGLAVDRFRITAASSQAVQTSAGAALDRFRVVGASSQAAQSSAGSAIDRVLLVGASSQAVQSAAGAAADRFLITAGSTQATQVTAGVASWTPASTQIAGASSQPVQISGGQAVDRFLVTGGSTQATQATAGVAANGVPVIPPVTSGGSGISRRRPRVVDFFRLEPDWLALQPRPTPIAARAASRQAPQATAARLLVSDPDEWLLIGLEIAA